MLARFVLRTAFEQFRWQLSPSEELGRTYALYVGAAASLESSLDDVFWEEVLGSSLQQYVGAVFLWYVGAAKHAGRIQPSWLDQPNFTEVIGEVSKDALLAVLAGMTTSPVGLRAIQEQMPRIEPEYRRYEPNPLQVRPVVLLDEDMLAPQPWFVLEKASATGVFYEAIKVGGMAFAEELGRVFEHYVGLQLGDIPDTKLFSEVVFGNNERSVDYFVATPNTLVLVEVKSTRLSAESRVAGSRLSTDMRRGIGKAFEQISHTARLIEGAHPAFAHLPRRPTLTGLVVTLEPYFVAHVPDVRAYAGSDPHVPTVVAAIREIEHLTGVAQEGPVGPLLDRLFRVTASPGEGVWARLEDVLEPGPNRNPRLLEAWAAYPWNSDRSSG